MIELMKKILSLIAVLTLLGFCLTGCQSDGTAAPSLENTDEIATLSPEATPENTDGYCWVIKIDQTITAPYLGELADQDEITSENTMKLVAVNDNESPYDGEFTGEACITSHTDAKEEFGVANADFLVLDNSHEAHDFTFALSKTDVVPLTPVQDERLHYCAKSQFSMPTNGDNPANVLGAAQGYQFADESDLNFSVTCKMIQSNQTITLKTDMFGEFEGTLEWTNDIPEISFPEE